MTPDDMAMRLAETESRSKSNTHRIDGLEEKVDSLNRITTAMEVMATEQKHQTEAMGEIKRNVQSLDGKVEAIEKKPARRWDSAVEKILLTFVGAVAAFILARLGM